MKNASLGVLNIIECNSVVTQSQVPKWLHKCRQRDCAYTITIRYLYIYSVVVLGYFVLPLDILMVYYQLGCQRWSKGWVQAFDTQEALYNSLQTIQGYILEGICFTHRAATMGCFNGSRYILYVVLVTQHDKGNVAG